MRPTVLAGGGGDDLGREGPAAKITAFSGWRDCRRQGPTIELGAARGWLAVPDRTTVMSGWE